MKCYYVVCPEHYNQTVSIPTGNQSRYGNKERKLLKKDSTLLIVKHVKATTNPPFFTS